MDTNPIIQFLVQNPTFTLVGVTCLIEIAPIKINPWKSLISWIGRCLNQDVRAKITELEQQIDNLEEKIDSLDSDVAQERVQAKRWSILTFSSSCRQGHKHTKEDWDHCMDELKFYESYCEEHDIPNGVIEKTSIWLNERYFNHLENNDFLED